MPIHNIQGGGSASLMSADLGTGSPSASTFLRGDRTWATPPSGGAASLTEVTVDCLYPPKKGVLFTIVDALVSASSKILLHSAQELEDLHLSATPGSGSFQLYVHSRDGLVAGPIKLYYTIG